MRKCSQTHSVKKKSIFEVHLLLLNICTCIIMTSIFSMPNNLGQCQPSLCLADFVWWNSRLSILSNSWVEREADEIWFSTGTHLGHSDYAQQGSVSKNDFLVAEDRELGHCFCGIRPHFWPHLKCPGFKLFRGKGYLWNYLSYRRGYQDLQHFTSKTARI